MGTALVAIESASLVQSIGTLSLTIPGGFLAGLCVGAVIGGGLILLARRE